MSGFSKIQMIKARRELEDLPEVFETYLARFKKTKAEFIIVVFKKSNQAKNFYSYQSVLDFLDFSK